jgi:hypothetical protein
VAKTREGNPSAADKRLIEGCQKKWRKYHAMPTRKNLADVGRHLQRMGKSKSRRVRLEAWRCAREYRPEVQEWIAMELRGEIRPAKDPDWAPLVDEEREKRILAETAVPKRMSRRARREIEPEIRRFERRMARSNPSSFLPAETRPDVLYTPKYGSSTSQVGKIGRKYYIRTGPDKPWIEVGTTLSEVHKQFTSAWVKSDRARRPNPDRRHGSVPNPTIKEASEQLKRDWVDAGFSPTEFDRNLLAWAEESQDVPFGDFVAAMSRAIEQSRIRRAHPVDAGGGGPGSTSQVVLGTVESRSVGIDWGGLARRGASATARGLLKAAGAGLGALGRAGAATASGAAGLAWEGARAGAGAATRAYRRQDAPSELVWGGRIDPKFVKEVLAGDEFPDKGWSAVADDTFSKSKIIVGSDAFGGKFSVTVGTRGRRVTVRAVLKAVAKEAAKQNRRSRAKVTGLDRLVLQGVDQDEVPTYHAVFLTGPVGEPAFAPGWQPLALPQAPSAPAPAPAPPWQPAAPAPRGPGQRGWRSGAAARGMDPTFAPAKPRGLSGTADPMYAAAEKLVRADQKVSQAYLSAKLKISRGRAKSIIDAMESRGVVSGADGAGRRTVLATRSGRITPGAPPAPGFVPPGSVRVPNPGKSPLQMAVYERLHHLGPAKASELAVSVAISGPYETVVESATRQSVSRALQSLRRSGAVRLTPGRRHWEIAR